MGLIKRISIALFIIVTALFIGFKVIELISTDDEAPVITVTGESLEVSVDASEMDLLEGVTALDNKDGDVTDSIVVESISKFVNNKRTITYAVCDSSNNFGRATRELTYNDYTSPRFVLREPLIFYNAYDIDWASRIGANDVIDGDISRNVKVDINGDYDNSEMEFSVTNSAGDTSHIRISARVYDDKENKAEIALTDYLIYVKAGEAIKPSDYIEGAKLGSSYYAINYTGGSGTIYIGNVSIKNNVDVNVPGTYTITYSLSYGGYSGSVDLIVVVEG